MAEVQKITKEEILPSNGNNRPVRQMAYANITSFRVLTGPARNSLTAMVSIDAVNAFRI